MYTVSPLQKPHQAPIQNELAIKLSMELNKTQYPRDLSMD